MKINSIAATNYACKKPKMQSFNGSWEEKTIYKPDVYHSYHQKTYLPDKGESTTEIAKAWEKETGLLPIDWVKDVNPYNQLGSKTNNGKYEKTEYVINGQKYMPVDVLIASAREKLNRKDEYDGYGKIKDCIELAQLHSLEGNQKAVKDVEKQIAQNFATQIMIKEKVASASLVNTYKEGWGTAMLACEVYKNCPKNSLYEESLKNLNKE